MHARVCVCVKDIDTHTKWKTKTAKNNFTVYSFVFIREKRFQIAVFRDLVILKLYHKGFCKSRATERKQKLDEDWRFL